MDEQAQIGRKPTRLEKSRPKWPLVAAAAVVCALLLGYFALCAYVSAAGKILPNVTVRGIDLGGLTAVEATTRLERANYAAGREEIPLLIVCRGQTYSIPATGIGLKDAAAAAQDAWRVGRRSGFVLGGYALLSSFLGGRELPAPLALNLHGTAALDGVMAQLDAAVQTPMRETTWQITESSLILQKGQSGNAIDRAGLETALLHAFETHDDSAVAAEPVVTPPKAVDFSAIAANILTAPADARFDAETREIVPGTVGVSLDAGRAQALFDATREGQICVVPLALAEPGLTTEELSALLFRDVLGQYTSAVGGTNNRAANVNLAAQACNERILMPGEVFSYNTATGSRTADKGYLPAPAYVGGLSVDEIGGGICQVSSTIYAAALRANMKIVERANHMYAVGYVPDGQDATVYFGSLDFRFENNTPYPLKLVAVMQNRSLKVQILGTRTDNTYVVMEGKQISSTAWKKIHRPDPNIAPGTTKEEVTPYTGKKVEAYRCIYNDNGTPDDKTDDTLISRTLESVNNYRHRDQVILFHPSDAASMNLDPATGQPAIPSMPSPEPSPEPEPSPDPSPEPTPEPSPEPTPSAEPVPSSSPDPSPSPEPGAEQTQPVSDPTPAQPEPEPPYTEPSPIPSENPTLPAMPTPAG